jgi:MOSC domain-containing protein YiiM
VWREDLAMPDLPYGAFGENFTLAGLDEESVSLGDVFRVGDQVVLQVSQPRAPCWKLARRWGIKDLTARVFDRNWGGWYHSVMQEGTVEAGMPVTRIDHPYPKLTIDYVIALQREWIEDVDALRELNTLEALTPRWRLMFGGMVGE